MNPIVAIGGTSKPFPKLKRSAIAIKLPAPVMIQTIMVPSNYINVVIYSIQVDNKEILLGSIPGEALALGMRSSFVDLASGMVAKEGITIVLRRLKSHDKAYGPFISITNGKAKRQSLRWKWRTFPTASRRKPLQFAISATKINYANVGSDPQSRHP